MQFGNKLIIKILLFLRDLLFPVSCLGCQQEGSWLCQQCCDSISLNFDLRCPGCGQFCFFGQKCNNCFSQSSLDGLWTVSLYTDELLKKTIHFYKYQGLKDLALPLGQLMINYLNQIRQEMKDKWPKIDIITSVPLHKRKFLHRGFNQTEILAQQVSDHFGWTYQDCISRKKFTLSQTKLTKKTRQENVSGVFAIKDKINYQGKTVIIIDDVVTTGATLQECAKVLKQAGVKKVWGLAIAQD